MLDANLIATLEKGLQETRNVQLRLMARLREVEQESERLRGEIQALENSASQTESMIDSLLVTMRSGSRSLSNEINEVESSTASKKPSARPRQTMTEQDVHNTPSSYPSTVSYFSQSRGVPSRTQNLEPLSYRFADRTITQACTLLLRESGKPLHVNELYNLLVSGGMEFKGNNPTISIAVSLNRNRRFKKVEPGTFDLIMRDASKVAS